MSDLDERLRSLIDTSAPTITLDEVYALEELYARRSTTTSRRSRRARTRRSATAVLVMAGAGAIAIALAAAVITTSDNTTGSQIASGGTAAAGGCTGAAYVTHPGTVQVIKTATGAVSAPIVVRNSILPGGVAITPDGKHVYLTNHVHLTSGGVATNRGAGTVSVITTATGKVSPPITVGKKPGGVAITPDGKHAYVNNNGDGTVSVITTATGKVAAPITVGKGTGGVLDPSVALQWGVAISPDGKHAYLNNGGTVSVITTATGKVSVIKRAALTARPDAAGIWTASVAVTPDGKHAYATGDGTVSVIDTVTGQVSAAITVGKYPGPVAITPDGEHAYVTDGWNGEDGEDGTVSVIDTATGQVSATITGAGPGGVAITPDGKHVYVTSNFEPVSVIDTATGKVSARITVAGGSLGVAICPAP